jgi:BlaI family penicillinase repressor
MNNATKITETEWEIMQVVWDKHPITAAKIIQQLRAQDPTWHPKTVRTLLARLVQRKALTFEAQGRAYVYEPKVTQRECVTSASESFLDRVFGGSLAPMLAHFVEARRLSKKDLAELQSLLENETKNVSERKGKK